MLQSFLLAILILMLMNIYQVKKYEQVPTPSFLLKILRIALFLFFLTLICPTTQSALLETKKDLPLEITEKDYKKEAILKFNQAVDAWAKKNPKQAVSLLEESLEIDPNMWISYLGLGQAYESEREYTKSLQAYKDFLKLAPKGSQDRKAVIEEIKYLTYILRFGEKNLKGEDYLSLVRTKHEGKEFYTRWDISSPLKIYFYPADDVPNYKKEFKDAFLEGAKIWQKVLLDLSFEVIDSSPFSKLKPKEREKKEKELIDQAQIKVVFPSRFKIKGDPNSPLAGEIEAQSYPIIRDKKNFRVLGLFMISPYIYYQAQIAIPLEPLTELKLNKQVQKIKILAAREVGHALGLWGFSPNPDDLMFEGEVGELKLSDRDIDTIVKLYELDPEKENVLTNIEEEIEDEELEEFIDF